MKAIVVTVSAELKIYPQTALAAGAALSPTSLGFSAQLLGEVGQLATPIGQLICTAAVIDDVLSLLLLAEVQALGDENAQVKQEQEKRAQHISDRECRLPKSLLL